MAYTNFVLFKSQKRKYNCDCSIRALMKLEGISWETAYIMLAEAGLIVKDVMNSTRAIEYVLTKRLGYVKGHSTKPPKGGKWPKVHKWCFDYFMEVGGEHENRKVFIFTTGHVIPSMRGLYYDTADSGNMTVRSFYYKD